MNEGGTVKIPLILEKGKKYSRVRKKGSSKKGNWFLPDGTKHRVGET